ncbi:MAG: hypothetical protein ACKVOU_10520 [Cytophagales bacterium]
MKKQKKYATGFLYSTPSFWLGAATVINISGNFYEFNSSDSGFESDSKAIENDFRMIGQDIYDVIDKINLEKKY